MFSHELSRMNTNSKDIVQKELSYKVVGLAMIFNFAKKSFEYERFVL